MSGWSSTGGSRTRPERVGEIVEVPHGDGSPPYVVRWLGEDHTCVVFPGPDAGVVAERPRATPTTADRPTQPTAAWVPNVRAW